MKKISLHDKNSFLRIENTFLHDEQYLSTWWFFYLGLHDEKYFFVYDRKYFLHSDNHFSSWKILFLHGEIFFPTQWKKFCST